MCVKNKIITTHDGERLIFNEWAEAGHRDNVTVLSAQGKVGSVRHISFLNDDYVLWWMHYDMKDDATLKLTFPDISSLGLFYTFRNDIPYKLSDFSSGVHLKDHFNMIYLPSVDAELYLTRGEYAQFGVEFSYEYLLRNSSARLDDLMENKKRRVPTLYNDTCLYIAPEIRAIIDELATLPFIDQGLDKIHLNMKVLELLDRSLALKIDTGYYQLLNGNRDSDVLEKIHEHILNNLDKDLSLETLAREFGLNIISLRRRFKKAYGCIPSEFIRETRMQLARKLLIETKFSVKEIATTVGFSNTANFSNAFRNRFNVWPKQLRAGSFKI